MSNALTLSITDKNGFDLAGFFNDLAQGLYAMDAGTAELLGPTGTALYSTSGAGNEIAMDYVTTGGQVRVTTFSITDSGSEVAAGTFTTPEPMGFGTWTTAGTTLFDDLLGNARMQIAGLKGDDRALGGSFADNIFLRAGNDAAYGGNGSDTMHGGDGADILGGGNHNDKVFGDNGQDMLFAGRGADVLLGGADNDVMVFDGDDALLDTARGGAGADVFLFNGFASTAGGNPTVLRTRVLDYQSGVDVLVFADATAAVGPIDGFTGTTLADLGNGAIDGFRAVQGANGVTLIHHDTRVLLRGMTAADVDLDLLLFTQRSATETALMHDSGSPNGLYARSVTANVYIEEIPSGYEKIEWTYHSASGGQTSLEIYGGDVSGFITYGAEGTT